MQDSKIKEREKRTDTDILGKPSEKSKFIFVDALGGQLYLLKTLIRYGKK